MFNEVNPLMSPNHEIHVKLTTQMSITEIITQASMVNKKAKKSILLIQQRAAPTNVRLCLE